MGESKEKQKNNQNINENLENGKEEKNKTKESANYQVFCSLLLNRIIPKDNKSIMVPVCPSALNLIDKKVNQKIEEKIKQLIKLKDQNKTNENPTSASATECSLVVDIEGKDINQIENIGKISNKDFDNLKKDILENRISEEELKSAKDLAKKVSAEMTITTASSKSNSSEINFSKSTVDENEKAAIKADIDSVTVDSLKEMLNSVKLSMSCDTSVENCPT